MDENEEIELDLEEDAPVVETDWKAEAEKAKADVESWKATAQRYKKDAKEGKKAPEADTSVFDAKIERLELKTDGYSDEAIDFIQSNGGKKALENQYVVAAVKAIQEQKKAEEAVIGDETAKSDFERKHTPEEIANMSPEELYKVLPKATK